MVTVNRKRDLIGDSNEVVVASNWGIEPALAAVYSDTPTIVDTLSAEDEDERFQCYPITDISVRLIDGEKSYVTSSPAGPVTMSAAKAYERLERARQFDDGVKSGNLVDIKIAGKIAAQHFPEYTGVADARYKQRLEDCLDGNMTPKEENELVANSFDSGIMTLNDGDMRSYIQKTSNGFVGVSRDQAFETLRAFANYKHLMNGDIREMEFAKALAKDHLPHLVERTDDALNDRYTSISEDDWFSRAGGLNPVGQYETPNWTGLENTDR